MSIYIAWGEDKLGPYTPAQVTQLMECGCLLPEDYAARDGEDEWMPLSRLLTTEAAPPGRSKAPAVPAVGRPPGRRGLLAALAVLAVLAVGLSWMLGRRGGNGHGPVATRRPVPPSVVSQPTPQIVAPPSVVSRPPPPVVAPPAPTATPEPVVKPFVITLNPPPDDDLGPPVQEEPAGRITGIASVTPPGASSVPLASLTIRVYLLKDLEPYLEQKKAASRAEVARLTPLLQAAETERNARVAEERSAREALLDAKPSDALYASLRFAHQQARGAIQTVEDDCHYYRVLRGDATGGEFYWKDLPAPLATVDTNMRGEFALDLPAGGPFALVANVPQTVPRGHARYWMVKASVAGEDRKVLNLSENNTTAVDNPDSLVKTEE